METEIFRAIGVSKNLVVLCLRLVSDAAENYSLQCDKNYILTSSEPTDFQTKVSAINKKHEANYRLAAALDEHLEREFSSCWIFQSKDFKQAAWSYRFWMNYSRARDSDFFEQEITQVQKAIEKYQYISLGANRYLEEALQCFQWARRIQKGRLDPIIDTNLLRNSQSELDLKLGHCIDWSAAFSSRALSPSSPLMSHEGSELRHDHNYERLRPGRLLAQEMSIYRVKIAAYQAIDAAIMQLHLTEACTGNNRTVLEHWRAAADFSSYAFNLRVKAAQATQGNDEYLALQWSLAAYAAKNVCHSHRQVINRLPIASESWMRSWQRMLHMAETVMSLRYGLASMDMRRKRNHYEKAAFWAEHSYECLQHQLNIEHKKDLVIDWEKTVRAAEQLSSDALYRAHRARKQYSSFLTANKSRMVTGTFNRLDRCFDKVMEHTFSQQRKKQSEKICAALSREFETAWQRVSFFLPKELFPTNQCLQMWKEGQIVPEIEFTCSHSWIYQTVEFLKEAQIPCDLSMVPKKCGVLIALTAADPSFGVNPPLSPNVFLVDVVADASPHPGAHFYIVQNQVQAKRLPNAHFIPHWPQSRLIGRNPERGKRFENIVFFGERENLAKELTSETWRQRLQQELGLTFKIEVPQRWYDYRDVDCAIGIRDFSRLPHLHKPATKLYNAWLAGVPFIGGSDVAFSSDGHPGKDYLMAPSLEELFRQLRRLKENESLRLRLVHNGFYSVREFTKEATCERWKKLIEEILPARALQYQKNAYAFSENI
jgi:hypothetical protein